MLPKAINLNKFPFLSDSYYYIDAFFRQARPLPITSSQRRKRNGFLLLQLLRSVVRLGGFRLDHDRGVAALIKFGLVRDGANNVAGRESHGGPKGSECCDEHRDDDFDDFLLVHKMAPFDFECKDNTKNGR